HGCALHRFVRPIPSQDHHPPDVSAHRGAEVRRRPPPRRTRRDHRQSRKPARPRPRADPRLDRGIRNRPRDRARVAHADEPGTHTITIRVSGTKGATAGKDVRVSIDAFKDSGTYKGTPSVSYRWASVTTSSADGGSWRAARYSGTYMTFVFRGTSIDWRTTL